MPIHADREGLKAIHWFKKKLLKPLLNRVHSKYRKEVEDRLENGWKRSTTPKIRRELLDIIGELNEESSARRFMDIFLVIYDSDNAYADFFHRFVEKCNNGELELKQGEDYLNYSFLSEEWLKNEFEQLSKMNEEERRNAEKKIKNKIGRDKFIQIKEKHGEPFKDKEQLREWKCEIEERGL